VVGVRSVPAGAVVGYNGTFVAAEPMRLALVAAGYGEASTAGSQSFQPARPRPARSHCRPHQHGQAVLDVTEIDGVEAGDEIVILGAQGEETITDSIIAEACGTIRGGLTRIGGASAAGCGLPRPFGLAQ